MSSRGCRKGIMAVLVAAKTASPKKIDSGNACGAPWKAWEEEEEEDEEEGRRRRLWGNQTLTLHTPCTLN